MNLRTCSLNNPGDDTADSEIIEEQISAIFFPLSNFEKETKQKKTWFRLKEGQIIFFPHSGHIAAY